MIHIIIVSVLVIVSTVLMGTFIRVENILPLQASAQAKIIDGLFTTHIWLISFFFSLIVVFILYSVVVFRRRKGELGDGQYIKGNLRLEIIWTVVPLFIVLYLAVVGANTLADVERRDPQAIEINVYAAQWSWRFEYANGANSNILVLPINKQLVFRLHSEDVIHSFWVPEFRVKQDILPGGEEYVRELRITPTELGDYKIRCAELCGLLHYSMLADVKVVSTGEFDAWLSSQIECNLADEICGQQVVTQFGCVACHSIDGNVIVGPSWLGIAGSQEQLTDGSTVTITADYLIESIKSPNAKIVEGFPEGVMPQNYADILSPEQIDQIVAYILSLE